MGERSDPMARRKESRIPDAILDQLLVALILWTAFDPNGLGRFEESAGRAAANAEIEHHLANGEAGNSRNGYGKKTVVTDTARIELDCRADRQSTFDPHLIAKAAAVSRLRRENHLDVRPRHERARKSSDIFAISMASTFCLT